MDTTCLDGEEFPQQILQLFKSVSDSGLVFVLIAPCTPRPSTMISDLNILVDCFGEKVYRSLIIAFIDKENKRTERSAFNASIMKMGELVNRWRGADRTFSENYFAQWNNETPFPAQEEELLAKAAILEPYY